MEQRGPAYGSAVHRERSHHDQRCAVEPHDRPAAAGHQLDHEPRAHQRAQDHPAVAGQVHRHGGAVYRERAPAAHREHGGRHRCSAGPGGVTNAHPPRPHGADEAGRQGGGVRLQLPHVHADQAGQPALQTRDQRADYARQLLRHGEGSGGPAASLSGGEGAAGPAGAGARPGAPAVGVHHPAVAARGQSAVPLGQLAGRHIGGHRAD
mmetsp:Transcript_27855/g.46609  ORF Transcript_27855/g.46609 Transcript_27855/m.46609 type:complete len:208 (-) Transcript_27855:1011-1634(-)